MKLLSRIVLMLYSVLSMAIWFLGFVITIFKLPQARHALYKVGETLNWPFLQQPAIWLLVLAVCAAGFIFNVYTFLIGLNGDREFKCVVRENSVGTIKIAAATFEHISLNVISKLGGVKDARAIIKLKGDTVRVTVHALFLSDVNIPALCEEAQKRIVQNISQCTDVNTASVKIIVDGVQNAYKGRVE